MRLTPIYVVLLFLLGSVGLNENTDRKHRFITASITSIIEPGVIQDTLDWPRPRFEERKKERAQLVRTGIRQQGIDQSEVLEAMRQVPRHLFVPENQQDKAYQNIPLPIGHGQTISQPYVVAYMTAMLDIQPGEKVLEIGTGSGYQAAVLSELTPEVYTIEIIDALGRQAGERFQKLGYTTIKSKIADGYYGWEEFAPFDAIIVTAAAGHVPPPLIRQLKTGGVMAIPIGGPYETQTLMKITKDENGKLRTDRRLPVRFVPMTGEIQN